MPFIQSVLGPIPVERLGLILPHEHLFTDLRGPDRPDYAQADPADVQRVMQPYLDEAWQAGITALVECSTGGVGRNPAVLERLARTTSIAIIAPAGVYREAYMPDTVRAMSEDELADGMIGQIRQGIEHTAVRAGFLKMAVSDQGISNNEARALRAAARAALATGVIVASHTSGSLAGPNALRELDILEGQGLPGSRFNWVHAHNELNLDYHRQAAVRGAYLGYDGLSPEREEQFLRLLLAALEAGLERHILLSHDAGWYRPGEPDGGQIRGFTYLVKGFLPRLRREGVSEETIRLLTEENPKRAFALASP